MGDETIQQWAERTVHEMTAKQWRSVNKWPRWDGALRTLPRPDDHPDVPFNNEVAALRAQRDKVAAELSKPEREFLSEATAGTRLYGRGVTATVLQARGLMIVRIDDIGSLYEAAPLGHEIARVLGRVRVASQETDALLESSAHRPLRRARGS